ncbi:SUMF1/EgtB/PvdO family nonheme iron enzyme [endosymbiont of Ridgeia piscesae]|jgi:iron(II)-dependent oxidoreductase|uniref:Formylglycine-generating enzyme, required for sulfatase activity n=1 Tax=endosymbiont of Ridgeia piscesae TaxID=54398 RepID=A0A0T5YWX4_9GAMM|nr:SUMF1/EgtB/PvdO family nonheme iron enzyme [endosymbiont of Ridgeia piscesae]KRT55069.1 Formylglycine-generating enzyme, required for sulfatase activity [endosymbiont of Ridgeia piscesae]KRT58744.1 Formylglycine-generating enzyme, required for sulfatase activity, contains SUMF1/FGE domain [endosymbiont of Ridgeia piscesae]
MTAPSILGTLSNLYEMQDELLASVTPEEAKRQYHPQLGSLNWLFGRGVYLELYWLREQLAGDDSLTQRVSQLFTPGDLSLEAQCAQLPPSDHLRNWAAEIRDDHLMRLANPSMLGSSPLLENERLQWFLVQEQAKLYEQMLLVLNQHQLQLQLQLAAPDHQTKHPLQPRPIEWQTKELSQGHYRIGSRHLPSAYDNELPPQLVELSSFRIALSPVSNGQYLAFMQAGGYATPEYWDKAGSNWLAQTDCRAPEYWRHDANGNWYQIGLNGAIDLMADEPLAGINRHEARAFAAWVSSQDKPYEGAVVQHEYQWEMAVRTKVLRDFGRSWEWCKNDFHGYPEFQPFPDESVSSSAFAPDMGVLRGGSLHTQRVLRRSSFRQSAPPDQRFQLSGLRLVFPALHRWT